MNALVKKLMSTANAVHVALYRRTGGRRFNRIKGCPVCLLTVAGRKTGTRRTTPVVYFERDGAWLVIGSAGGAKVEPQWFRNLRSANRATLKIGDQTDEVAVRITDGEERHALWAWVVEQAPFFDGYPIAVLTATTT